MSRFEEAIEPEEWKDPYNTRFVGIDLGTTHSLVARVSKGMNDDISNVRIDVMNNETGGDEGKLVPSVVTFDPRG